MEELRYREEEVECLWNEEQQQRLAEVAEDRNNRKRHPREVAERVANENARRIPAANATPTRRVEKERSQKLSLFPEKNIICIQLAQNLSEHSKTLVEAILHQLQTN